MSPPPSPALRAALYVALHDGTPGDRGFYADVCQGATSVLELGCGGGRLLPVLAAADRQVVGIDIDAAMLAIASREVEERGLGGRVQLQRADMRTVDLPTRFDRVVLAFNGLWCLPGRAAIAKTLANAARHLQPGGRLALDVYRTDAFHLESEPQDLDDTTLTPIASIHADGTHWDVSERSHWDPYKQRIEATYVHRGDDGRTITTSIRHHYVLQAELEAIVAAAGLPNIRTSYGLAGQESLLLEAWA